MSRPRLGEAIAQVTEWDWFCHQLRVLSNENYPDWRRFSVRYLFQGAVDYLEDEPEAPIVCQISIEDLYSEEARQEPLAERREWLDNLVDTERRVMRGLLAKLPRLRTEIDLERDLVFEIGYSAGMGFGLVCTVRGSEVTWAEGWR